MSTDECPIDLIAGYPYDVMLVVKSVVYNTFYDAILDYLWGTESTKE